MKKSFLIFIFTLIFQSNVLAEENCKDLPGFKKLGKGSVEYTKCIAKKGKELGIKIPDAGNISAPHYFHCSSDLGIRRRYAEGNAGNAARDRAFR